MEAIRTEKGAVRAAILNRNIRQCLNNCNNLEKAFVLLSHLSFELECIDIDCKAHFHPCPKWKQSLVTNWQSWDNDFSEERLNDDCEVFPSVVPAGFHKVVQHKLKESRRSKCLISWLESLRSSCIQPDIFCWAPRASEGPPSLTLAE